MAQFVFNPGEYTVTAAKPMPVVLVLDNSGSMRGEKIASLNQAVRDMLNTLRQADCNDVAFRIAILTFGTGIHLLQEMTDVSSVVWQDIAISTVNSCQGWNGNWDDATARGTPLGKTLQLLKSMVEDKAIIPGRAYRPAVILVSDGQPTDTWKGALQEFTQNGRSSKCDRWAMAIGRDADAFVLQQFITGVKNLDGNERKLLYARDARSLRDNFKFITMSVTNSVAVASKSKILTVKPISVTPTEIVASEEAPALMQRPQTSDKQGDESGFDW